MPEPVLVSIAAALAGKAATSLYDLVRKRFSREEAAAEALESGDVQEIATALERAEEQDPEFSSALREEWRRVSVTQHSETGGVSNQISGNISGKAVQAGHVHGDINL